MKRLVPAEFTAGSAGVLLRTPPALRFVTVVVCLLESHPSQIDVFHRRFSVLMMPCISPSDVPLQAAMDGITAQDFLGQSTFIPKLLVG